MSEERQDAPSTSAEAQVKVTDRRRFSPEGEPIERPGEAGAPGVAEPGYPNPDERDEKILAQANRIDELVRAYAALVEDNKAFRQRTEREKARVIEAERASIAQALLEAGDDLERALSAVGQRHSSEMKTLVAGVELSLAAIRKRISELGAERIPVTGLPYDPQVAEAVDMVPVADASQDGQVVEEVRAGYRIKERVLRPARVRVGRYLKA